jgi:hypothetical protein
MFVAVCHILGGAAGTSGSEVGGGTGPSSGVGSSTLGAVANGRRCLTAKGRTQYSDMTCLASD